MVRVTAHLWHIPLAASFLTISALGQTAPQRADEFCAALRQTASESSRSFSVTRPGACMMFLDRGYNFIVEYDATVLHLGLTVNADLLGGDASAFWLRLSTFDNLVHTALHTKQQAVFDEMNKLVRTLSKQQLDKFVDNRSLHGRTEEATLMAGSSESVIVMMASADVKGIEKMERQTERQARSAEDRISGGVPAWRKILGLSLKAFGSAAKAAAEANKGPIFSPSVTCYTDFLGTTAVTRCH